MKNIREKLGLSQKELASLLGTTRTTLAMHETNHRTLQGKQLQVLTNVEILLQKQVQVKLSPVYTKKVEDNNAAFIKDLNARVSHAEFECLKLKRRLEKLRKGYEANQKLWAVINELKLQLLNDTAVSSYLNLLEITCQEKIVDFGLDKQALLQYQISLLEQQKKIALKVLNDFSKLS